MKKLCLLILSVLLTFVSCSDGVMDVHNPDRSGNFLDLANPELDISFSEMEDSEDSYKDFQGNTYPVNENGYLTSPTDDDGRCVVSDMPAVFTAIQAPNTGYDEIQDYNFGYEYTVKFRLTDDTTVEPNGGDTLNEPQGMILPILFLADGGDTVNGALMLMIFPTEAFPQTILSFDSGLDENVILAQNYDPDAQTGHVVAVADVTGIEAANMSLDVTDPAYTEQDLGIHTATVRIDNDADETHGPTIHIIVNGVEVITYQNTGSSHSNGPGAWDDDDEAGIITTFNGPLWIATEVLGISSSADAFVFDNSTGIDTYNENWNAAIYNQGTDTPVTSLIGFGAMFQIGMKETDAGSYGSGAPGSSKYKCPEIVSVDGQVYPYEIETAE